MSGDAVRVEFRLNGEQRAVTTAPERRLLDVLRGDLERYDVKEGCGEGECGTCSVLLDGRLANACLVPVCQIAGADVWTVAGASAHPTMRRVVEAFAASGAVQCGFCTPGMVLAATALLLEQPAPDDAAIRESLAGNLCRCTGYVKIVDAVARAATDRPGASGGVERGRDG
jgi:aerobic-type carbon monoxide dehydrogenase small subunit (CoxS/CutS family)